MCGLYFGQTYVAPDLIAVYARFIWAIAAFYLLGVKFQRT
jgi:hypothetical protein